MTLRVLQPALCVLLLALASASAAATELTSLGDGLAYLNIHSLANSEKALRTAMPGAGALVLDLRHVVGSGNEPLDALRFALASRPRGALLVLVSPATPRGIADVVAEGPALTLGVAEARPRPAVVVLTSVAADQRAYDALVAGTPVADLISGTIEKGRFDEATLVQEFKNGNPDAAPPPTPDPTVAKPASSQEKDLPPVDRVLQRAVHLHHALVALHR
jgi:hypothetical protein